MFSNSLFYRKTGTCNDLSVNDTDYSCFLISDRKDPSQVQENIDQGARSVSESKRFLEYYIRPLTLATYNLEVICYASNLSPLSAMGIAMVGV